MPNTEKDRPLVSAVILTHNRSELVIKAIRSVQNQTYPNIELIVVDDASEQDTTEQLQRLAELDGFQYYYIPKTESRGGNYGRNYGARVSHGEIIAFLDDDDEWLPEKTEKQLRFLEEHPDYGMVSCPRILEIDGKKRNKENVPVIEGDVRDIIFTRIPYITSTIMIRKPVLEEAGCFDEELRYFQDYELTIRVAQCTKCGYINEHLCLYRINNKDKNRMTNQLYGWENAIVYIEKKYEERLKELPPDYYRKHQLLIATDGIVRARHVRDWRKIGEYHRKRVKLEPTVKNLITAVLATLRLRP